MFDGQTTTWWGKQAKGYKSTTQVSAYSEYGVVGFVEREGEGVCRNVSLKFA